MELVKSALDRVLYWVTAILFAILVVVVVWQVFTRQIVGSPATWTDEGARLTFVWLGLFASAFVFGERGHIAVEFLARKLPLGVERLLAVGVQVVVLGFSCAVLIWGGWRTSQNAWNQELSALPFTVGHMYLALPVAGLLIAFYSLYFIQAQLRGLESPYTDSSEEDDPQLRPEQYTDESKMLPDAPLETRPPTAKSPDDDAHRPDSSGKRP